MPLAPRAYWAASRSHRYSLLFALPLLLLYELLELVAPIRSSGGVIRNGADVILTGLFVSLLGPRGPLVFMALVICGSLWLIWRDRSVGGAFRPAIFPMMFGESLLLALAFGFVVGTATAQLLGLAAGGGTPDSALARLTLSLGAGLYEELLFRVVLVALIANGLSLAGLSRKTSAVIAVIVGALLLSAFHHIGPLGEPLRVDAFVFRTVAGLAFSALYLTRGFGITAWTHALYDVFVLLG